MPANAPVNFSTDTVPLCASGPMNCENAIIKLFIDAVNWSLTLEIFLIFSPYFSHLPKPPEMMEFNSSASKPKPPLPNCLRNSAT